MYTLPAPQKWEEIIEEYSGTCTLIIRYGKFLPANKKLYVKQTCFIYTSNVNLNINQI